MNKLLKTTLAFGAMATTMIPLTFADDGTLCGSTNPLCNVPSTVTDIPKLISLLLSIAIAVAVLWTLFNLIKAGIQYTGSGADASKKKEALGSVISAVVGLVIVLVSFVIIEFVGGFFNLNVNDTARRLNLGICADPINKTRTGIKTYGTIDSGFTGGVRETEDSSKQLYCRFGQTEYHSIDNGVVNKDPVSVEKSNNR